MRDPELRAVLLGNRLVAPPHPAQRRLLAMRKGGQKASNSMVSKAKNRETHRGLRHDLSKDDLIFG
jgi:hypothetical protein